MNCQNSSRAEDIVLHLLPVPSQRQMQPKGKNFSIKTKQSQIDRISFVITYHPDMPKIHKILEQHWPKIESSSKLKRIFPEKPLVVYKRPKSLKDILV